MNINNTIKICDLKNEEFRNQKLKIKLLVYSGKYSDACRVFIDKWTPPDNHHFQYLWVPLEITIDQISPSFPNNYNSNLMDVGFHLKDDQQITLYFNLKQMQPKEEFKLMYHEICRFAYIKHIYEDKMPNFNSFIHEEQLRYPFKHFEDSKIHLPMYNKCIADPFHSKAAEMLKKEITYMKQVCKENEEYEVN